MGVRKSGWHFPPPAPPPTTTVTNDSDGDGAPDATSGDESAGTADILIKESANFQVKEEILSVLDNIVAAWKALGLPKPVITSANDGEHKGSGRAGTDCSTVATCRATSDSFHYEDLAIDLRGKPEYLGSVNPQDVLDALRGMTIGLDQFSKPIRLSQLYDVTFDEVPSDTNRNHFHFEFDPNGSPEE